MAGENATDEDLDPGRLDDSAIDEAVDGLRGVLKKDAGEEPVLDNQNVDGESVDGMSGAEAIGSDFGADVVGDDPTAALDDPFNIGDAPEPGASDLGAPDLGAGDLGAGDLGAGDLGAGDLGATDFGATDFGNAAGLGGAMDPGASSDFGAAAGQDFGAMPEIAASPKLGASGNNTRADLVLGIPVDVQIILGASRMAVSSLMDLSEGATIALDRKIGEPVEIMVNGKLIGRGEITVLESDETRFAIRIIEVIGTPHKKTD